MSEKQPQFFFKETPKGRTDLSQDFLNVFTPDLPQPRVK